ncbi:T9SS type A sorting domain-containing protein [bacterium]|nr:T9SS type A sorting domain-containing protein [bacterium]
MKKNLLFLLFAASAFVLPAQNWTPMAAGMLPANYVIFSISAVGDDVVWAVASGEYYQAPIPNTHRPYILRTSNGGQTWKVAEIEEAAGAISFRIVAVDSLTAWITTQDYGGGAGRKLYRTADGGDLWTLRLNNIGTGVALNLFEDGQHWLAHNRQAISRSDNNGATWANANLSGYTNDEFQLVFSGTNMSCTVGDTLWNGTSEGRLVRFTDFGASYEFLNAGLGTGTVIYSVAFQDHENGLLFNQNSFGINRIARSTNGGATWANLASQPGNFGWNIAAVPGAPGAYVLASNYGTISGRVAITQDFGNTWSVETLGQPLNSVVFTSPETGWVGGGKLTSASHPALFKYNGSPLLVGVQTPPVLPGFSVFPNPATGTVFFDFEGYTTGSKVFVSIHDLFGRAVFKGEVNDNNLDLSTLTNGIYVLNIEANGKKGLSRILKY